MLNFAHILLAENPQSSNAHNGRQYVSILKKLYPAATSETMSLAEHQPAELSEKIQKDTLLCIAGGDGTANSVVQALLMGSSFTDEQRRTPILPLWGGNANDLAHMLNGRPSAGQCRAVVEKGAVVPVFPLRCTIKTEGKKALAHLANCYISFGATAQVARHFNESGFRHNPFNAVPGGKRFNEAVLSLKALHDAPTFVIEHEGERKIVYDWIIGKGPRMAKYGRLPISLTDQTFYQSMTTTKSLPDVVSGVVSLAWGLLQPANDNRPITFTTTEPIWAQFDGEPVRLPTHTEVTISLNARPFYALSTVLKDNNATLKS